MTLPPDSTDLDDLPSSDAHLAALEARPDGAPIGVAIEDWLTGRVARRELAQSTARTYRHSLAGFVEFVGADTPMGLVTPAMFENWLASQRTTEGRDLLPGSLNTRAAPVRAFFEWATRRRLIAMSPTSGVSRARQSKGEVRRLEEATVRRLLLVADFRTTVVILLGVSMGLRACETAWLSAEDWQKSTDTLRVMGKGQKVRHLPMVPEVGDALTVWLDGRRSGPVFESQHHGGHLGPSRVSQLITAAARRAGVDATHHRLRHTYAVGLVQAGVPMPVVQALLGHETLATTSVYTAATASELREHVPTRRWVL